MELFIHQNAGATLEDFSDKIFSMLNIADNEERDSINYPPNCRYFVGYGKLRNLKLWDDDSLTLEGYPFVLTLADNSYKFGTSNLPDRITEIAKILAQNGIQTFVPSGDNYWSINWNKQGEVFAVVDQ